MAISPITSTGAGNVGTVNPVVNARNLSVEQAQNLSSLGVPPTTVDLSTLGRFLSLASLFQKRSVELQASLDTQSDAQEAFRDVAAVATALAGMFNELQTSPVDSTGLPSSTLGQRSLASEFLQQFGGDPEDTQASLANIGVSFELENFTAPAGLLVDEAVLQSAFEQDPEATTALLDRTADAFIGLVATQVQAQAANIDLFADETEATSPVLPAPLPVPVDLSAAPDLPPLSPSNETDRSAVQNLATGDQRSGSVLPDDGADGIPQPRPQASEALPTQLSLAPFQDPQLAALQEEPATQAFAPIPAPVVARLPALAPPPQAPPIAAASERVPEALNLAAAIPPAPATPVVTQAQPLDSPTEVTVSRDDAVTQGARVLAEQLQAERDAARELDEKIAAASDEVRAALAEELDQRELARLDQQRLERELELRRADQRTQALADAAEPELSLRPDARTERVVTTRLGAHTEPLPQPVTPKVPVPTAPNQALQAARDPAIAAAIAAYNMSTGPFAAQNVRPDLQPPKARPIPPVAGVTKVAPTDAIGTPRGDTAQPR